LSRKIISLTLILVMVCACGAASLAGAAWWRSAGRPQPAPTSQELFSGVSYSREVRNSPRPMVVHTLLVDLRDPGVRLLVTPGDPDAEHSLRARTTSDFLEEFDLQVAVNGDGFQPWYSNTIFSYYPHKGDPIDPTGLAASQGTQYAPANGAEPTLYISRTNRARFNEPIGGMYNAISGLLMLAAGGKLLPEVPEAEGANIPQPRTAVGLDKNSRHLIIVVVDGRQPGYSEGISLVELAELLIEKGAFYAMNMDGGGSSTMVSASKSGKARLLNSPIDQRIPGRERPVGNHLGIYASTGE
jgi:Phosphodiester glycosidase